MKKVRMVRSVLFAVLICIVLLQLVACSDGSDGSGNISTDNRPDLLASSLKSNGFFVNEGSTNLANFIDFVNDGVMDSAAGNQATQKYKRLQIPVFPVLTEDPVEKQMGIFRLRLDEAIVYVGPTPPKGDYFSFTLFLWTRFVDKIIKKGDWFYPSLADPLNNTQIKVEGGGKDTFQKNTMVIFTADKGIYEQVVAQAIAAGYPASMINLYIIPSGLLYMGLSPTADTFAIGMRVANIVDAQAGENFFSNDNYARVFRITPDSSKQLTLNPFPTLPMANRKATAETDLVPPSNVNGVRVTLSDSLENLKKAILAKYSFSSSRSFESIRWWLESRDVLNAKPTDTELFHKYLSGEASDTPYIRTSEGGIAANFKLGNDDMMIVYGVNHEATGLATYSNFAVYGEKILNPCINDSVSKYTFGCGNPMWNGVAGMGSKDSSNPVSGTNHFTGSAAYYIPNDPNAKYLYAVRVLRKAPTDSEKLPTIVVPTPEPAKPASGIELDDPITIGYRAYVNPLTGHGPDYGDIIYDRAIWFKLK